LSFAERNVMLPARLGTSANDSEAWDRLVCTNGPHIVRWCRGHGWQDSDAVDVTQDDVLHISQQIAASQYDASKWFRSWLKTIVHASLHTQGERRREWHLGGGDDAVREILDQQAARENLLAMFDGGYERELFPMSCQAIRKRVEPHTWEAFRLLAAEGLTVKEVAARLGMKLNTAYAARLKVERMIREEIERLEPPECLGIGLGLPATYEYRLLGSDLRSGLAYRTRRLMNPWILLAASALLLTLPILIRPKPSEAWEFSGFTAFLWHVNAAYCRIVHRLENEPATLPTTGPAILIANHTCNIDHFLLQATTGRKLGFLISRSYYDVPAFRPFCKLVDCIPVNSDGKDSGATRSALRALKEGRVLPIFPEGRMLPLSGREIGEAKPGVAFIATRAKVPVIPAYIRGTPESKKVFISFISPSRSRIYYGEPIDPTHFILPEGHDAQRAALAVTTEIMMDAIRALKDRAEREEAGASTQ
jgi:RNA polymerase sigma factor (sigma-70 family)